MTDHTKEEESLILNAVICMFSVKAEGSHVPVRKDSWGAVLTEVDMAPVFLSYFLVLFCH